MLEQFAQLGDGPLASAGDREHDDVHRLCTKVRLVVVKYVVDHEGNGADQRCVSDRAQNGDCFVVGPVVDHFSEHVQVGGGQRVDEEVACAQGDALVAGL